MPGVTRRRAGKPSVEILEPIGERDACELCRRIDTVTNRDLLLGEEWPEPVNGLVHASSSVLDPHCEWLARCPHCNRYYSYLRKFDNDVYNLYDSVTLQRISVEEARRWIAAEDDYAAQVKARNSREASRIRTSWRAELPTLSAAERTLFIHLFSHPLDDQHLDRLPEGCGLAAAVVDAALETLERRRMVRRSINWPLSPGAHNFQEECRGGDPRPYTRLTPIKRER